METLNTAIAHFTAHGVRFANRCESLHFAFETEQGIASCVLNCYEDGVKLVIEAGPKCPPAKLEDLGKFVLGANYCLWGGRFDLNLHTGHFCYAETLSFAPGEFTDGMLERMIGRGLAIWDRYLHGAMSVVFGGVDPIEAVALCESSEGQEPGPTYLETSEEDSEPTLQPLEMNQTALRGDREWVDIMERLMGLEDVDPSLLAEEPDEDAKVRRRKPRRPEMPEGDD